MFAWFAWCNDSFPTFRSKGAKVFCGRSVAINSSLPWSEKQFRAALQLNSQLSKCANAQFACELTTCLTDLSKQTQAI